MTESNKRETAAHSAAEIRTENDFFKVAGSDSLSLKVKTRQLILDALRGPFYAYEIKDTRVPDTVYAGHQCQDKWVHITARASIKQLRYRHIEKISDALADGGLKMVHIQATPKTQLYLNLAVVVEGRGLYNDQ